MAQRADRSAEPADASPIGERPAPPPLRPSAALSEEERAAREARLATAFEGALRDQQNGQDFVETTGYRKLLEQLAQFDPAEVSARAERSLDYEGALADPDAWRGEFVRVRGLLGEMQAQKLMRPVLGRGDAWRVQLAVANDPALALLFDSLDPPLPELTPDQARWRAVEVEGVFYRTVAFEAQPFESRGRVQQASYTLPWLLVRNVRLIDEGGQSSKTFLEEHAILLFGLLAFVIFGSRLVVYWVRRRRPPNRKPPPESGIRELFEQKLRERGAAASPTRPHQPPSDDG
jgi:hypothetical protein